MSRLLVWLAAANPNDLLTRRRGWGIDWTFELTAIFGALGLLVLLIILWAVFIRKSHRRHHRHHRSHRWGMNPDAEAEGEKSAEGGEEEEQALEEHSHKRHRRRRRREHYPRNPTLAETGGLPPIRHDGPPRISPP